MLGDLSRHYDPAEYEFDFAMNTIPYGTTVTGVSYIYSSNRGERSSVASLPKMAPAEILIGRNTECTGSAINPTAAKGYFCTYKLDIADCATLSSSKITGKNELGQNSYSRQGIKVTAGSSSCNPNGYYAWAYTAPDRPEEGNN